jgi:hypothetical protein
VSIADEKLPNQTTLIKSGSAASIPLSHQPKIEKSGQRYIKNCGLVLCFYGYFKEAVHESQLENYRVRQCEIFFFLEDDSISIVERKVENSGVPQGTFAKRGRMTKSLENETFYNLEDLQIGHTIQVYGRKLFITDCNASTRRYLVEQCGRDSSFLSPVAGEEDMYTTMRAEFMSRETGRDDTVVHNIMKNPMTEFAEAQLGNTVDNSTRQGFLEYGRQVLKFDCYWDDRESLFGDVQRLTLIYYLYDDTIEILNVGGAFNKMVKRGKLYRNRDDPKSEAWHWTDFTIGSEISVYSKKLFFAAADTFTYEFYDARNMPLSAPIQQTSEDQVHAVRELPPYNGYGSEEDSLASCVGSLVPTVPHKKLGENKIMRFMAKMESRNPEDMDRNFTISFYLIDNTVQIHEPPKRNSGIVGGSFLSRMKLRTAEGLITQEYFYVGAEIQLAGHPFILVDADEGTLKHMEGNAETFENSNIQKVCQSYSASLLEAASNGELLTDFQSYDGGSTDAVSIKSVKQILMKYGCSYYYGGPPEQAVLTLCRSFGNKQNLQYKRFIEAIVNPSSIAMSW